jgi:hypothetical protein
LEIFFVAYSIMLGCYGMFHDQAFNFGNTIRISSAMMRNYINFVLTDSWSTLAATDTAKLATRFNGRK